MQPKLKVEIVTEKRWQDLLTHPPCEHVSEDSLGYAEPSKGRAYVRQTFWPELNKYLIQHEFEHLLEEQGTDECSHGLRHKRGFLRNLAAAVATGPSGLFVGNQQQRPVVGRPGGVLNRIANPIYEFGLPAIGTALGTIVGGPAGGTIGGALGGAAGRFATGGNVLQGAAYGGAGGGAGSFLAGSSPQPGAGAIPSSYPGGLPGIQPLALTPPYNAGAYGGFINRFAGIPQVSPLAQFSSLGNRPGQNFPNQQPPSPPPPSGGNFFSGLRQGLGSFLTGMGQGAGQGGGQGLGQGLGQYLGSNAGNIGQLLAAAGALGIGERSRSAQIPEPPNLTAIPSVQNIVQTAGQGQHVSPLGQLGQQQLTTRLNTPFQGVHPLILQSIRDSFDRQRRDFASQFKTIRPNADIASDFDYARNLSLIERQEAQAVGDVQQREFERFQAERTQDIGSALGVDNRTLGVLMDDAQLDINQIQAKWGISVGQAQQFKQTFGHIAGLLAARPLGLTSFTAGGPF